MPEPITATVLFVIWGVSVTWEYLVGALISATLSPFVAWLLLKSKKGIQKAKKRLIGTSFLIVGPPETGKTSLLNYFMFGHFPDTHPPKKTVMPSPINAFSIDKGGEFKLDVKKNQDFPGEFHPDQQAAMIANINPNCLIVMLTVHSKKWLEEFLASLSTTLYINRNVEKKLLSLVIVINKIDTVGSDEAKRISEEFSKNANEYLKKKFILREKIPVFPCSLFKEENGERYGNIVLSIMLNQLKSKKPMLEIIND